MTLQVAVLEVILSISHQYSLGSIPLAIWLSGHE